MASTTVHVQVPASTSNLGSGFDTLGLALEIPNNVKVAITTRRRLQVLTEVRDADPTKATAIVREAVALFFRTTKERKPGLTVTLSGEVPIGRGLGASASARVGVLVALNELFQKRLTEQDLLDLATRLEGHPDNASPALLGGFTVSGLVGNSVRCLRFPVSPDLRFITLIPPFEMSTEESRKLVPSTFSKRDAAHALNRAALIGAALASRNYRLLRGLFDDRFHQPYRQALIPQLSAVIKAGEQSGAIGGWLSGSGSAIMCLALEDADAVGRAMQNILPDSKLILARPDNRGAVCI